MRLPIVPTRTIDLSDLFGAGVGFHEIHAYSGPDGSRLTRSYSGIEGEGIAVEAAAMERFQALVGGQQLFLSDEVDLGGTPSGIALVPAVPGFFFVPVANDPLMVINLASGGTLITPPLIRCGNPSSAGNYGGGVGGMQLDSGTFGQPAKTTRSAFLETLVTMADLATPITLDVVQAATGAGLSWSVRFAITGSIVQAF